MFGFVGDVWAVGVYTVPSALSFLDVPQKTCVIAVVHLLHFLEFIELWFLLDHFSRLGGLGLLGP